MLIRPALVVLLTTAAGVLAQSPAKTPGDVTRHADYRQAQKAVNDGLAEAAVPRLEKLLADPAWKGEPGHAARLLLAEALVRSRNGERAVALLTADGATDPVTLFWKGAAQASAGQLTAADQTLAALTMPFPLSSEAVLTRASVLTALGQSALVLEILKPLTSSTDTELATRSRLACAGLLMEGGRISEAESLLTGMKDSAGKYAPAFQYLQARASLLQNRAEAAAPVFAALAEGGRGITRDMRHAAALGYALATQRMGRSAEALATLEKLIGQSPAPPLPVLESAFAAFEELNNPPTPEADSFLQNWARSTEPGLKTLANLALASILENGQRPAEALAAVRAIAADAPSGPLKAAALLREARLSMAAEDLPGARAALEKLRPIAVTPALRAWTSWMEGTMQFTEQRWKEAAREFTKAALESQQAASQAAAAYNAALAELRSGLHDPRTALGVLASVGSTDSEAAAADFQLERALYLASIKDPGAAPALQTVLATLPNHPRRFDALAAQGELLLAATPPPDAEKRTALFASLEAASHSEATRETIAWLRVTAARLLDAPAAFETAATTYMTEWPASARLSALRMWLGESLYQRQKFAAARTQFEALANANSQDPLAEPALFWAARSALRTLGPQSRKDAIELWERVYKLGRTLKLEARLQVADLNKRDNDHAAALQLYASILDANPPASPALRWQVLCSRGEVLVAQRTSPATIAQGLASFDEVAADPAVTPSWKHEAWGRKGTCLETLQRPAEALDTWHSVLTSPPDEPTAAEGGDYWFHRAGEKAIRYLESEGKYPEAVQVARRLSAAPGPRGQQARTLMDAMALKHGIWISPGTK